MYFSGKELELDKIIKKVTKYSKTNSSVNYFSDIKPYTNKEKLERILVSVSDTAEFIARIGKFPLLDDFDIYSLLNLLDKGYTFSVSDIMQLRLLLVMEKDIRNLLLNAKKLNIRSAFITEYIDKIHNHSAILSKIDAIFNNNGEIYDDASPELKKIRKAIHIKEASLSSKMKDLLEKYKNYLSEPLIAFKNGRYCLPVQTSFKSKVKGTVLEVSQTKQTLYIEPEAAFLISSELQYQKVLENDEINKILNIFTNELAVSNESLSNNLDTFVTLDILQSKALYALEIDAYKPNINNNGNINILKAKHPLIDKEKIVPIDIMLNDEFKTMVITGPNTGGKTVALKTTGLLSLMVQIGLLVPCDSKSDIAIFNNIYADIGDEQSIEQSLSTFSSHLKKIKFIIDNAKDGDLVLLDEIGSGTDPEEGASLAVSILDELRNRNLRLIATTHYSELKVYAYEKVGVLAASVAFDEKKLSPLYYLILGSSGTSNAFLIAKRMGLKESVITNAEQLMKNKESDFSKVISDLNNKMLEVQKEKNSLDGKMNKYDELLLRLNNEKSEFESRKDDLLKKIEAKEKEKWNSRLEEARDLISVLRKKDTITLSEAAEFKKILNKSDDFDSSLSSSEKINLNDSVYIRSYQKYGTVTGIKKDVYEVSFGDFKLNFRKDDLKLANAKTDENKVIIKPKKESGDSVSKDAKLELDLRGYRFEEVKDALEAAIDKAIVSNLSMIYVIHGYGTFAVKKAVDDVIKKSKYIKSSRPGGEGEGLKGVTVIYLK